MRVEDPRLDLRLDFLADRSPAEAYAKFLGQVFGCAPSHPSARAPDWEVMAYFEADGSCVAGIEVGDLTLVLDGVDQVATAIRLAGVAPSHRGRGLFRRLVDGAIRVCGARAAEAPTLLYAENAALYARFGFVGLDQHAFVGAPPPSAAGGAARIVDRPAALAAIDRFAAVRAPVSLHCAVRGATGLLCANLDDDDLRFAALEQPEALLIYETSDEEVVIVDIVAAELPDMATIAGALEIGTRRVRTLFPPDRLGWDGVPVRDDTGLMIRGPVPAAMRRPFMLPPTTSF